VSLPSERISEMTDDQIIEKNTLTLNSHESLRSNESKSSLKNVFSQSQKIQNIAARYIHVQDDN
jgi:lambda repressor-like predicted transcriptional regulator